MANPNDTPNEGLRFLDEEETERFFKGPVVEALLILVLAALFVVAVFFHNPH